VIVELNCLVWLAFTKNIDRGKETDETNKGSVWQKHLNSVHEEEIERCMAKVIDFFLALCSLLEDLMQKQCMRLRNFATLLTCLTKSKDEWWGVRAIRACHLNKLYLDI